MKNVFLSVVIICALTIAGVGGTLANFSDTEEVVDNTFESGSLDLLVYDGENWVNDPPWGPGASGVFDITCAAPGDVYSSIIKVANVGDCVSGDLFMRFKPMRCYNVDVWQHDSTGIWMYDDRLAAPLGRLKPEPELVAEYGGFIDQWEYTPDPAVIKVEGDNCSWTKILEAAVKFDGVVVQQWKLLDQLIIDAEAGTWIELGELESCGATHEVEVFLRYADQEPDAHGTYDPMFNHWPTNRYMLDGAKFDIMFGLVQDTDGG